MPDSLSKTPAQSSNGSAASAAFDGDVWPQMADWLTEHKEGLVKLRRRLHATPERSGEERATTAFVAEKLREHGLEPRVMADDVGVVVDIDLGATGDNFIALRSELDCVEVNDDKQVAYASTRPGLCHACGHDAHTTIVLSSVLALHHNRERLAALGLRRNIRAVFQPAEETSVGARSMIQQGAIDNVDGMLAVHVDPFVPVGVVGVRNGPITSGCKSFEINIRGRSGRSARPHEAVDPIAAAINVASMFYELCPRSVDSRHPVVLTVASIQSGSAANAIPDSALMRGTLRSTHLEDLETVKNRMEAIVAGVQQATGCNIEMSYPYLAPPTDNDARIINAIALSTETIYDRDAVYWVEHPSMGAEDFAFFQELIPGAIVRLGVGYEDGRPRPPLHSSRFDIDENALDIGAKVLSHAALSLAMR